MIMNRMVCGMNMKRSNIMEFLFLLGKLKSTPRTGWVRCGIKNPESIADHMYRMATMAFLVNPCSGLAKDRCIKMALVHDMAESIVGDLTPHDDISVSQKHQHEQAAMDHIAGLVSRDVAKEFMELWQEYEDQATAESKFVKDLDRFDMILQAFEYETAECRPSTDLEEFFASCEGKFQTDVVKDWAKELYSLRSRTYDQHVNDVDGTS